MKILFGTNVMFYEKALIPEYCQSVGWALDDWMANKRPDDDFVLMFGINTDQSFEKTTGSMADEIIDISNLIYKNIHSKYHKNLWVSPIKGEAGYPYTMINFRRDLNNRIASGKGYFRDYDFVVWGETDCLLPESFFIDIQTVHEYVTKEPNATNKYVITFADRKMWDDSWKLLEHPEFTNKPYYERDDPKSQTELHSIRYTINQDELDAVNKKYAADLDINIIRYPKFDGSLLVLSKGLLQAGANIPPYFWGISGEDTAMMESCKQIMGEQYVQYIIKSVCKGHNREHPRKRESAVSVYGGQESTQRSKGGWYDKIRDINKENLLRLYSPMHKQLPLLTYQDFLNAMKDE